VLAALAKAVWLAIAALSYHSWDISSRTTRFIPCSHYGKLAPLLSRDAETVLPYSSHIRATVTSGPKATLNRTNFLSPRHSLYGGGHTSLPLPFAYLEEAPKERPRTPSQPLITSLMNWTQLLLAHTHEEIASLATLQKDHTCLPCEDVSGVALHPSQIQHYVYGGWQGTLGIKECLDRIFKVL